VTFKDLQKVIQSSQSQASSEQTRLFQSLRNKPFWIWNAEQHKKEDIRTKGDCCFNHIVSLPTKIGVGKPLFDYQRTIYDSLQSYKHLWIKKATGLGITEFMLRYMAWLCSKDSKLRGTQMCIVTGPRIDLAITLIDRMKGLFEQIEKEPESTCLYKRLYLDYTVGLGKIYTIQEIERAKQSPSFERE
jgi:hypothetical protein